MSYQILIQIIIGEFFKFKRHAICIKILRASLNKQIVLSKKLFVISLVNTLRTFTIINLNVLRMTLKD